MQIGKLEVNGHLRQTEKDAAKKAWLRLKRESFRSKTESMIIAAKEKKDTVSNCE